MLNIAVEEIAAACASSALILMLQELGTLPIELFGSDELKQRFLPRCGSGEWSPAFALSVCASRRPMTADGLGAFTTATSRRVIRQMPIRSGSSIQSASAVPACAHWVALRTSSCNGARARRVSSHGAASAKKDSEATAVHAIGSAKSATMAGVEASRIAPNATPTTIPVVR